MKMLLAGDSTVTEQPRVVPHKPLVCYCGWGQVLHRFFCNDVQIQNYAVSGYTVEMFRGEGQYAAMCAALAPGDYVLFQFGHNDQKRPHLRPMGGFAQRLAKLVEDVRAQHGVPVLVTSVARNSWRGDDGTYCDLLEPYADTVRGLGVALSAPVLDLHAATVDWMLELGLQRAKRFFYPGDYTHPNEVGGVRWARFLAQLLRDSSQEGLHVLKDTLLPDAQWPQCDDAFVESELVCGWTASPVPRSNFAKWRAVDTLSYAQALEMAQEGYGYFVAVDVSAKSPFLALAAAKENGYLPADYPQTEQMLSRPISGKAFATLMRTACRGRNELPGEAMDLIPKTHPDGSLSGVQAARYALDLERLATGSAASTAAKQESPEGA